MIQIIPKSDISTRDIMFFRGISKKSISEIKEAAAQGYPVREFKAFSGEWRDERKELVEVYRHFESSENPPYRIKEVDNYGLDEFLTPEKLRNRIEHWREIELETECDIELELGEISHPDEFEPKSENWT